ncbi:hypothetical protein ACFYMO_03645 [Streptomyces sp. NPDC007025]|uniref:hypothetical protein n=1 Tax=Streptomyces sp. NPDC007025 TaxID=3364771 RepID=UPI0036874813
MSLELRTYRTARTAKRCNMHLCHTRIQPGDRYLRASLPPLVDPNSSEHWWSMNVCTACMTDEAKAAGVRADEFNARYPVGTRVIAYPGARPEDDATATRIDTTTRSRATVLGGHTAVVWVHGHSACIALTHIDVLPGGAA